MQQMLTMREKVGIASLGGFCVVGVRFAVLKFYIGMSGNEALIGVLTAAVIMGLTIALTCCLFDALPEKGNLFLHSLVAPVIAIALVHAVYLPERGLAVGTEDIPEIQSPSSKGFPSGNLFHTAFAHAEEPIEQETPRVEKITKKDFAPSITDGALLFLGHPPAQKYFIFVIGKTRDVDLAADVCARIVKLPGVKEEGARLISPAGSEVVFVAIGQFTTAEAALSTEGQIKSKLLGELPALCDLGMRDWAYLVAAGKVLDGRALLLQ